LTQRARESKMRALESLPTKERPMENLSPELVRLAVNTIKMLAADGVEKASSGHPGMPMGAADYAFELWTKVLRFHPRDPAWPNRDRFVLSAGHGSMLLYSLLHLSGYDLPMSELQSFRQWGSKTPGHPEVHLTPGVETTTGPLGQGFANGVGMAIGAKMLAARFNTPEHTIFDHRVFGIVSDGDLMEGVAAEAASLAGHLGLGNLIYLYDDNHISIEGDTAVTYTDDVERRFEGYHWHVQRIDGHDAPAIRQALDAAIAEPARPSIIICRTKIGKGAATKEGSHKTHGEPLGKEELAKTKAALGWPAEPAFHVPNEVREVFARRVEQNRRAYDAWQNTFRAWAKANPEKAAEYTALVDKPLPSNLFAELLAAAPQGARATRETSGIIEQRAAALIPALAGGSADLEPSTKTWIKGSPAVSRESFVGRNFHFGVREHGMGSVMNGLALHGTTIPYGATFLVFADYMRPAIRLAALSEIQAIFIFTHDSVFLGEDGPTHQPIEHVAALRLIPNLYVVRPFDGVETAAAWTLALERRRGPTAFVLTRQKLAEVDRAGVDPMDALRGGYVLARESSGTPDVVLLATGSEVPLAAAAREKLEAEGRRTRVVSLPCLEAFEAQPRAYRESVLPKGTRRVSIEAGRTDPWKRWVGEDGLTIGIDRFGASAPDKVIAEKLGFTRDAVAAKIREWLTA
jgi:transketolase